MKVNSHTINFVKQETPTHVFYCKFGKVFQNMFLTELIWRPPLKLFQSDCYLEFMFSWLVRFH